VTGVGRALQRLAGPGGTYNERHSMRTPITCTACQRPLTGGTDTFGDIGHPTCQDCFAEHGDLLEILPERFRARHNHDDTDIKQALDTWWLD